jgi:hypothetical protein
MLDAVAARLGKLPTKAAGLLATTVIRAVMEFGDSQASAEKYMKRGKSADDALRFAAFLVFSRKARNTWHGPREFPKIAKALGVDLKGILAKHPIEEKKVEEPKAVAS